jgi:hypothetical protein
VAKKGIFKHQHAIAYNAREEPEPFDDELPGRHETPMMLGIRIKSKRGQDKVHERARIDFGRMYTVEHNVKVYEVGDVHPEHTGRLVQQWRKVLDEDYDRRHGQPTNLASIQENVGKRRR